MARAARVAAGVTAAAVIAIGVSMIAAADETPTIDTVAQAAAEPADRSSSERRGWGPAEPGERRFGEIGARMTKPPKDYKPRVSAEQAKDKARNLGLVPPDSGELTADLVVYSNDVYGDIQSDNTVRLKHQNVRAWAVRTEPVEGSVRGPADRPAGASTEACPFIFVIDAETGDHLAAFQTCDEEQY